MVTGTTSAAASGSRAGLLRARAASAFVVLRRVRFDRVLIAVSLLAAAVLVLVETPVAAGLHAVPVVPALGLAVLHAASLPLAFRAPHVAASTALAAALALQALDAERTQVWPWWPVLIVTQALVLGAVALRVRWPALLLHWLIALAASALLAAALRPDESDATAVNLAVFGGVTAGTIGVAHTAAQWRRIRSELLHERRVAADEAGRRLVMEERTRIARELHDVIAHSMSIITVQSSTAKFRHPGFDADAVAEFDRIGALSRQALDEMRGLLQVLRGSDEQAETRPQPGLPDLPELVAQADRAGTRVTFESRTAHDVGDLTGLAAYRIVQEAISNAIRHSPGSAVHVTTESRDGRLHVAVVNGPPDVPVRAAGPAEPGHGLVGMAERAATVGGSVRSEPEPDGGFSVRAVLPIGPVVRGGAS